jgi:hypothetical protein
VLLQAASDRSRRWGAAVPYSDNSTCLATERCARRNRHARFQHARQHRRNYESSVFLDAHADDIGQRSTADLDVLLPARSAIGLAAIVSLKTIRTPNPAR